MSAVPDEVYERLHKAEENGLRNELGLKQHEAVCAERYGNINITLNRIGSNIRWAVVTLLTGMGAILTKLLFFPS